MDTVVKAHMISLVNDIKDSGHDLDDFPVLFQWTWEEVPGVEFQMLIRGTAKDEEIQGEGLGGVSRDEWLDEVEITAYDEDIDNKVKISRTLH